MKKLHRSAFTLFQLLVVLALLGILLGLLLPAIAKVRQAAARTQSANNLKQLGLAAHNYYSTFNMLPPGVDANHFSTTAYLLPFVEQDNLFKTIDFKKSIDDQANAPARGTTIRLFLNPQDPIPSVKKEWGATNYLWSAGSKYDLKDNDGMFYRDSKLTFDKVADGLSNTVMAGETLKGDGMDKAIDVRRQHVLLKADALKELKQESGVQDWKDGKNIAGDRCASWIDGRFLQGTFTGTRMSNDARPDVNCAGQGGLSGLRGLHGGVNILMGDGSVRFVRETLKLEVWQLLANRSDGQVLPDF
jgi:prepilin-type processing-associated H-X9-DG protein